MMEGREIRVVRLEPWMLGCVSHRRVDAYEALARELHPEAFAR
jgi:iron complex transport system substrate-binding protein